MNDNTPPVEMPDDAPNIPPPALIPPQKHSLVWRLLAEHNPFYLLSAACMLASCLALTNTTTWSPIAIKRILVLIITLNVYEALVLGMAIFLVRRKRLIRDGKMLLILQAFFLVDFSFLNAEIATVNLSTGIIVNIVLLVLAVLKLGAVVRYLGVSLSRMQLAFVLIQIAMLFTLPCLLRHLNGDAGHVGGRHLYVAWWFVGMLPALYELMMWFDRSQTQVRKVITAGDRAQMSYAAPVRMYLALPWISLLTHMGILHYVYDTAYIGADAAPVLLGLTFVLGRFAPVSIMPRTDILFLRAMLPLAAVLVSLNNPFVLAHVSDYPRLTLTALNLTIVSAFITYVFCLFREHALMALAGGLCVMIAYVFGPPRVLIVRWADASWNWTIGVVDRFTPRTATDWGVIGLVAAFGFLIIGFWISLRKEPPVVPVDPMS